MRLVTGWRDTLHFDGGDFEKIASSFGLCLDVTI